MKHAVTLIIVGIVCAVSLACHPGAGGLTEQDKAAIRQLDDNFIKVITSEKPDWDAVISGYYAEDATKMLGNQPAAEGRAAIKAVFAGVPPIKDFKLTEVSLEGGGDIAYRHYTEVLTLAVPGVPEPVTERGKGIEVFKKQADGTWRVIRDISNSDLPPPGLTVPTGAVAADASDELKKLADIVGRWKFDGTWKADPKAAAGPVDVLFQCEWFAGGKQVIYKYGGTMAGIPYKEIGAYSYDPKTKGYSYYGVVNDGTSAHGVLTIKPGSWLHGAEFQMGGEPVRSRFTLSDMSPAGGTWKQEVSVAGGSWTVMGEGKYTKAN